VTVFELNKPSKYIFGHSTTAPPPPPQVSAPLRFITSVHQTSPLSSPHYVPVQYHSRAVYSTTKSWQQHNMLVTARYTSPASLMLLRRCRIQRHDVSTTSLTGCVRTASNSMPTRRSCCVARPFVSCSNYPAARSLLLVNVFVLSTTISVRPVMFGELCHAASLHFASFVTFVDASPTTASVLW